MSPSTLLGFVPVLLFLAGLLVMDSYKLVARRAVLLSIGIGMLAAIIALIVNRALILDAGLAPDIVRRYAAPLIEEILKGLFVVWLIRAERVGFMVDAAIHGFAIGTGFALIENVYYLNALDDAGLFVWLVRGLGTAVLHGAMTAIFAILAKGLTDRHASTSWRWFLPGLGFAFVVHSGYNHLILNPLVSTALLLGVMPLLLLVVFERSERATRDWLGSGLDGDAELLELILSGEVAHSRVGEYLDSLRHRFPPAVVADMLCLLEIHVELSMRAKGMLIAQKAGVRIEPDESVEANLRELKYLEKSIGETGLLAIMPLRRTSSRDIWQIAMLGKR